jgi:hypothetical protein
MKQKLMAPQTQRRFWAKVDVRKPAECWPWRAARHEQGYGIFQSDRGRYAHRAAYELDRGEIPEGQVVRHKCHNPCCVNPQHLELGTAYDNIHDSVGDDRHSRGVRQGLAKLNDEKVRFIRANRHLSGPVLAERFGVTKEAINYARAGVTWKHI